MIGVTLLTVLALTAIAASSAQAITAPYWAISGTRLGAGQTHNITGKAVGGFTWSAPTLGITITCTAFKLKEGVLLGSAAGAPGTDNEVVEFTGCTVAGNGTACTLSGGAIKTNTLKLELVENVVGGASGKQLLTEFFPASGASFVTITFAGTCTVKSTTVAGSVAAEDTTDTSPEKTIELGEAAKEATSWNLLFPATAIKEVSLIKNGAAEIVKVGLEFFGFESILTGTALTLLANSKFETEAVNWSPLP